MNTHFKKALDKIVVEEALLLKTKHKLDCARQKEPAKKEFHFKKILAIACSFVFVASVALIGYVYYKTPVAYVSLDINPSIELGINAMNTVVTEMSYNADGQKVLEGSSVLNTGVEQAIHVLVESASNHGYISKDGSTVISVTSETDNKLMGKSIQTSAEAGAKSALTKNHDVAAIYKENIPFINHTEALSQGVSPGKLNLIHKVQTLDNSATVAKYKDAKVTEIMKKYVVLKKKINAKPVNDSSKNHQDSHVSSTSPSPSPSPRPQEVVVTEDSNAVVDDGKIEDTVDEVNNNKDKVVRERHKEKDHPKHDSTDKNHENSDSVTSTPLPTAMPSPTQNPNPRPSVPPRNGPHSRPIAPPRNGPHSRPIAPPENGPHSRPITPPENGPHSRKIAPPGNEPNPKQNEPPVDGTYDQNQQDGPRP